MVSATVLYCAMLVAQEAPKPKVPLGKATTYITEPLDRDGYIDYETALNERLRKQITPDQNAVVLLWQAIGPNVGTHRMPADYFKWLGVPEPPDRGEYMIGFQTYLKDRARVDVDEGGLNEHLEKAAEQLDRAMERPWRTSDFPNVAGWLQANKKPLALAINASKRPEYYNPLVAKRIDGTRDSLVAIQLLNIAHSRDLARALAARALLRVGDGKADEAWPDLIACHRLGRLTARGGDMIESLVGLGINKFAMKAELAFAEHAKLTGAQMQQCLRDLQSLPPLPGPADKIDLAGRFTYLDCAQFVRRGGVRNMERWADPKVEKKEPSDEEEKALAAIDWQTTFEEGNQYYNCLVAALRLPNHTEREKEFVKLDNDLRAQKNRAERMAPAIKMLRDGKDPGKAVGKALGNMLVGLLSPNVGRIQRSYDLAGLSERSVHIAFALSAYQRDHRRYPAKLDDLVPNYLRAIPEDLYSGKPSIYRASDTGYVLYSVGRNGRDDSGLNEEVDARCDDHCIRCGDQTHDYLHRLQGAWELISSTETGEDVPPEKIKGHRVIFEGNQLTYKDSDKVTKVVTIRLDPTKSPVWFDTTEGQSATILGLMHLGSDGFGICTFNSSDQRPTEMKSETGTKAILVGYRRQRK